MTGPGAGTVVATGTGGGTTSAGSMGQCIDDSFVITSPGAPGSPLICGTNNGYHSKFWFLCTYLAPSLYFFCSFSSDFGRIK